MFRATSIALTALLSVSLCGCGILFRVHRLDVQQGNIITESMVNKLHKGMSKQQVINVLGQPVLSDLFPGNKLQYVYTWQPGYGKFTEKRLVVTFRHGHVVDYKLTKTSK